MYSLFVLVTSVVCVSLWLCFHVALTKSRSGILLVAGTNISLYNEVPSRASAVASRIHNESKKTPDITGNVVKI